MSKTPTDLADAPRVGARVEIPVHYDAWMQGARYGVVAWRVSGRPGRSAYVKVKLDNPRIKRQLKVWALDWPYLKVLEG